jgi:hypothetical protein
MQERYGRYGMWERERCLSREIWDGLAFEGRCVCLAATGNGHLVDGMRDHGMPHMTKSHVPVRLLSNDTSIRHLDPESVRQGRALISTLAASIQTSVPDTETTEQTSPTFPRENTQRSSAGLVNTDNSERPEYIEGKSPKQLYSLGPSICCRKSFDSGKAKLSVDHNSWDVPFLERRSIERVKLRGSQPAP